MKIKVLLNTRDLRQIVLGKYVHYIALFACGHRPATEGQGAYTQPSRYTTPMLRQGLHHCSVSLSKSKINTLDLASINKPRERLKIKKYINLKEFLGSLSMFS